METWRVHIKCLGCGKDRITVINCEDKDTPPDKIVLSLGCLGCGGKDYKIIKYIYQERKV